MQRSASDRSFSLRTIMRALTNNFGLKFLSFAFAIVLFFIVRTDKETIFEKMAKIKIVTLPNMTVIGSEERYINVSVRLQNSIFSIPPTEAELTGEVYITTAIPGKINVKITRENFSRLPKQFAVFIDRPYIEVETDRLIEKNLSVHAVLQGEPATGLVVNSVTTVPEVLKVSGARQELMGLENLNTVPIKIDGATKTLSATVPIDLADKPSLKIPATSIQVVVTFTPKNLTKMINNVPVGIRGGSKDVHRKTSLYPDVIAVEVTAPKERLERLNAQDVHASIDGSALQPGWQDRKIILQLPENTSLIKTIPDSISVHLDTEDKR